MKKKDIVLNIQSIKHIITTKIEKPEVRKNG
jgi:hypothetical protein